MTKGVRLRMGGPEHRELEHSILYRMLLLAGGQRPQHLFEALDIGVEVPLDLGPDQRARILINRLRG